MKHSDNADLSTSALDDAFLDAELIQAGDVLLTRGPSVLSTVIATATGGAFSHAAVWMHVGEALGGVMLAEADGLGVDFTPMLPCRVRRPTAVERSPQSACSN